MGTKKIEEDLLEVFQKNCLLIVWTTFQRVTSTINVALTCFLRLYDRKVEMASTHFADDG